MYNVEVLSKFPVVQHFPFGSLFRWDPDPNARSQPQSIHTSSQPDQLLSGPRSSGVPMTRRPLQESTKAPWATRDTKSVPYPSQSGRHPDSYSTQTEPSGGTSLDSPNPELSTKRDTNDTLFLK